MVQFYLLSILLNILVGIILIWGKKASETSTEIQLAEDSSDSFFDREDSEPDADVESASEKQNSAQVMLSQFDSKEFRLIVGILSVFVGVMKFLTVYRNDIPVIGDLLPALAGLLGGASLLVEYYLTSTSQKTELHPFVKTVLVDSRVFVGIACLVVAFLHFICPGVVLL